MPDLFDAIGDRFHNLMAENPQLADAMGVVPDWPPKRPKAPWGSNPAAMTRVMPMAFDEASPEVRHGGLVSALLSPDALTQVGALEVMGGPQDLVPPNRPELAADVQSALANREPDQLNQLASQVMGESGMAQPGEDLAAALTRGHQMHEDDLRSRENPDPNEVLAEMMRQMAMAQRFLKPSR